MQHQTLTAADALRQTRDLDRVYSALERRTSGLTWIVWGIAITGLFMTYSFLGLALTQLNAPVGWMFSVAWVPWVAMGYIASALLWRSVALAAPEASKFSPKEVAAASVLFVAFIAGALYMVPLVGVVMVEPALILLGVGDALAAVGVLGLFTREKAGRVLWLVAGVALSTVAVVASLALGANTAAHYAVFSFLAPASVAVAFFANGVLLNLRG